MNLNTKIKKIAWTIGGALTLAVWVYSFSLAGVTTTIQFSSPTYRFFESNGSGLAVVVRTGDLSQPSSVFYYTTDASATSPADYAATSGVLDFGPGDSLKYIPVSIVNDFIKEPTETFEIHLDSPTGAALGLPKDATAYIVDGASTTVSTSTIHFESTVGYGVREVEHVAYIAVDRDGDLSHTATVAYNTTDGSATSPADYTATTGVLTFKPGESREIFAVPVVEDSLIEPLETVGLHLSNPVGALLGQHKDDTLYITDTSNITLSSTTLHFDTTTYYVREADGVASIKIDREGDLSGTSFVNFFTSDGSAINPADYSFTTVAVKFNPGESQKSVLVPIASDSILEPTETVGLHLSPLIGGRVVDPKDATLFIIDSTTVTFSTATLHFDATAYFVTEDQWIASIKVDREGDLSGISSVNFNTTDGSATSPADYSATTGVLTFNPGESQKIFTIPIASDLLPEPTENVGLHLSNPSGGVLVPPKDATLFIIDSTTVTFSSATLHFDATAYFVTEAQRIATIKVIRDNDLGGFSRVTYNTTDGSATNPADYQAVQGELTFNPGESEKTFTIPVVLDNLREQTETVGLHLSSPVGATLVPPKDATLFIIDSTTMTFSTTTIHFETATYHSKESDYWSSIKLIREGDLSGISYVTFRTTNGTAISPDDYWEANLVVQFNPGDSKSTVLFRVIQDNLQEPTETIGLHLSNPINAVLVAPSDATLLLEDTTARPNPPFPGPIQRGSKTIASVRSGDSPKLVLNLPDAGDLEINILDRTGRREVKTIHREVSKSGETTIDDLNPELPIGVYRLKIKLNGQLIKETPLVLVP